MLKFAPAFLLCVLWVSTLTAAHQNSLVDIRSEEEALQEALIAEIGQPLKRDKKAKQVLRATDKELLTINDQIWKADENRFPHSDVVYNVKGPTLFTHVNEELLLNDTNGTYARMIDLFDYYDAPAPMDKLRNKEFDSKVNAFLDAILDTPPIKVAREWVEEKAALPAHRVILPEFKKILLKYWFTRNGQTLGSNGFKHTFVGEIDLMKNQVMGLHNWVRMFWLEKAGKLFYRPRGRKGRCPVNKPSIKVITFDLVQPGQTYRKISSAFIRTSPEVEIALYTICVLTRTDEDCPFQRQLKGNPLNISVSAWTDAGQETIRSAFPICDP